MKKKVLVLASYILVSVLSVALTIGILFWQDRGFTKLDQLEALIEVFYIEEADMTALEDAAAEAMIKATGDRWSHYIPASEYASYVEISENAYVGIGVTIAEAYDGSGLQIMEVSPGSSAEEAGIQVNDVIIEIEGQDAAGMTIEDARNLVRGKEGTRVKLSVRRAGDTLSLWVTRQKIEVPVVVGQLLDSNVGLISIANFEDRCADETIAAVESLRQQGAEKLIFDVRNNPGGYARELVPLLDYLLPEGELFRTVDYAGREETDYSDAGFLDMPMAVLVNRSTYSAAEFFAVALQEYEAAVVAGEKTTGKGYFQNTFPLSDGSAVSLSTGKYFTPRGISLEDVGITPDVEIVVDDSTYADIYYGQLQPQEDPQIQAAVNALK